MKRKNPWLAAIFNFIIWGIGYIYNGKRIALGIVLLLSDLALTFVYFLSAMPVELLVSSFIFVFMGIGFAYDAYNEAKEINQKRRKK